MKKSTLTLVLAFAASLCFAQQRLAYVDSEYILGNIPEYNEAIEEIDALTIRWQKEIEERFQEIDKLFQKFQSEAPLLSEDMRKRRENEIITKEREAKELQKKRFGADGDLFKKRQEMLQPIQDKVYASIEKVAKAKNFEFVFDLSDNANLLYTDTRRDISNDILNDMGLKPNPRRTIEVKPEIQNTGQPAVDRSTTIRSGTNR